MYIHGASDFIVLACDFSSVGISKVRVAKWAQRNNFYHGNKTIGRSADAKISPLDETLVAVKIWTFTKLVSYDNVPTIFKPCPYLNGVRHVREDAVNRLGHVEDNILFILGTHFEFHHSFECGF